jgi:hypothetical protein
VRRSVKDAPGGVNRPLLTDVANRKFVRYDEFLVRDIISLISAAC